MNEAILKSLVTIKLNRDSLPLAIFFDMETATISLEWKFGDLSRLLLLAFCPSFHRI